MLRKSRFILSLILSITALNVHAQADVKSEKKSKKKDLQSTEIVEKAVEIKGKAKFWMKSGDKLSVKGANYAALENYNIALSKTKKKKLRKKIYYKMGESSYANRDYVEAEKHYKSNLAIELKKNKFPYVNFQIANSLKYQADYVNATNYYNDFVMEVGDKPIYAYPKSKARLEVKGCEYALSLEPEELKYVVENAGQNVNGTYADFGPDLRGQELVFSKIYNGFSNAELDDGHIAKLYTSQITNYQYLPAEMFASTLNEGEEFVCNPSFTADGQTIYFTKCVLDDKMQTNCSIYVANLKDGVWTEPKLLGLNINALASSNSHPQITVDLEGKERLFFTSNRVGGKGGKDIWMAAKKEDGTFARAKNLGSTINSRFDEISPFYHQTSNKLFFSTDGKISLGGFDIYFSKENSDGWNEASMLPKPINSSVDDFDFIVDGRGEAGVLVSNRIGTQSTTSPTCCDDIFTWRTTEIDLYLKGLVYAENETSRELLENANIQLLNVASDSLVEFPYTGKEFLVQLDKESDYVLKGESDDFEAVELNFSTKGIVRSDTLQYDLFFTERKSFNNEVIGIIYYEYNQARLTKEAPKTLKDIVLFLKTYPKTTVEISAHTDGKGPAAYNLDLSQERCLAAANYLTFNGVGPDRIVLKWYGETQPAAPNTNKDGSDNPEGRGKNRRTEFKIVE